MFSLQNLKHVSIAHASTTNGATASGTIDTLGFDEVLISVTLATSNTTSNNPSVFTLQECDTSNGTFTAITGYVGDTDWTIPAADTASRQVFQMHVPASKLRYRYLKLLVSPTTTQVVSATALLGRAEAAPDTTTEQGTVASVNG